VKTAVRRAFTFLVVCVASVIVARGLAGTARTAPATPAEVRGLWVVRTSLTSRDRIAAMIGAAVRGGFNTLVVQVRGRGEAFYKSALEPRGSELDDQPAGFDPLAVTLELGHRAGLRVHAWVGVNFVSSSATLPHSPSHVLNRHPEWLMVPAALAWKLRGVHASSPAYLEALADWTRTVSDQVEGLYLSPIPAGARQHTVDVVRELVTKYAVDGVQFDYVRYPNETFDYSAAALAAFRAARLSAVAAGERRRLDQAARTDPIAWTTAFPQAWDSFRRDRLTWLLHALTAAVRSVRPHVTVSAAVVPRGEEARERRLQDWPRWAAAGDLDIVCPMVYVSDEKEFRDLVAHARTLAGRVPLWAGIGAYRLPATAASAQIRAARRGGAAGVLIFSYDSLMAADAPPGYLGDLRAALVEHR
jgi:uncharacterized lipoprotein YddW (UPF0748 family)